MDSQIIKELQIQNLLNAISQIPSDKLDSEKRQKILDYIFECELSKLQLDIALFPRKDTTVREYKFQ